MDIITIFLMGLLGGLVGSFIGMLTAYITIRNAVLRTLAKYKKIS